MNKKKESMKYIRVMLTALCLSAGAALRAQNMVVYLADGTRTTIAVSAIDSIRFEETSLSGHEYVDLGLSVLWATCNVGAAAPEQYGYYYAWGETTRKSDYSESRYRYYSGDQYQSIGADICGTKYDVARTVWGGEWRMPSLAEIEELTGQCTWTWTERDGVGGYRVQGSSGASIFLPAAGYYSGKSPQGAGQKGFYWSGMQSDDLLSAAYNINFAGYAGRWTASRAYGFSVRPVHAR